VIPVGTTVSQLEEVVTGMVEVVVSVESLPVVRSVVTEDPSKIEGFDVAVSPIGIFALGGRVGAGTADHAATGAATIWPDVFAPVPPPDTASSCSSVRGANVGDFEAKIMSIKLGPSFNETMSSMFNTSGVKIFSTLGDIVSLVPFFIMAEKRSV
jgi:hypothetical protein